MNVRRMGRYYTVAIAGTFLDFGLYSALVIVLGKFYLVANIVSFWATAVTTYLLHRDWTFRYTGDNKTTFVKYVALIVFSFVMSNIILFILVSLLGIFAVTAKAIQLVISAAWGYLLNQLFVFRGSDYLSVG